MAVLDNFEFGPLKNELIQTLRYEFENNNLYESVYPIKEGDIVVDVGASSGVFTYSILNKKPKHVFALEPSINLFPYLVKNTIGHPVTQINKAIGCGDGISNNMDQEPTLPGGIYSHEGTFSTIKFSTFIKNYGIDKIDFLKLDCEGGEYNIITNENIHWILNNVTHIVGEWHLGDPLLKTKFRWFRDNHISKFKEVQVRAVNTGDDITSEIWDEAIVEQKHQVIIHLKTK
jgi:FkbM family methyltransferase